MGEATPVTATALTEVRSVVTATTMEARLAAITASLNKSLALLASSAQRLGLKEKEEQVATAASFATMTMSRFVQDQVREKLETKLLPSSFMSTNQVVDVGAPDVDAVFASAMPSRCSTLGSAVNFSCNHAVVAFPTSGRTNLPATTSIDAWNNTLQGVRGKTQLTTAAKLTAATRSVPVPHLGEAKLALPSPVHGVRHTISQPSLAEHSSDVQGWQAVGDAVLLPEAPNVGVVHQLPDGKLDMSNDKEGVYGDCKLWSEEQREQLAWDDEIHDDVVTHVDGISSLWEFGLAFAEDVCAERLSKDVASGEEFADTVLTHVGDRSLFVEHDMDTCHEFQSSCFADNPFGHGAGLTNLLRSTGCPEAFKKIGSVSVCGFNSSIVTQLFREMSTEGPCQGLLEFTYPSPTQRVLAREGSTTFFHVEQLLASKLHSSWDPGGSWSIDGYSIAYSLNKLLKDSVVYMQWDPGKQDVIYIGLSGLDVREGSKSVILASELCFQWKPGTMLNALMDAMSGKLSSYSHLARQSAYLHRPYLQALRELGKCILVIILLPIDMNVESFSIQAGHFRIALCQQLKRTLKFGLAEVLEDDIARLVVSFSCTFAHTNAMESRCCLTVLQPEPAIAWGQAMFLGGGNVMTTLMDTRGCVVLVLGPWADLTWRRMNVWSIYTRGAARGEGIDELKKEQNQLCSLLLSLCCSPSVPEFRRSISLTSPIIAARGRGVTQCWPV